MSERELVGWQIFWCLEPPAATRVEIAIARLTAIVANMMRGEKQDPFTVADFLPEWGHPQGDRPDEDEPDDGGFAAMQRLMRHQEQIARRHSVTARRNVDGSTVNG